METEVTQDGARINNRKVISNQAGEQGGGNPNSTTIKKSSTTKGEGEKVARRLG